MNPTTEPRGELRRPMLITAIALGAVLTCLGGVGLFAALNDSVSSDGNSVESGALSPSADLKIATADVEPGTSGVSCGAFSDGPAGPLITLVVPSPATQDADVTFLCLRNDGSAPVDVVSVVDQLQDVDLACTGDEMLFDDSCGMDGQGELAARSFVAHEVVSCQDRSVLFPQMFLPLTAYSSAAAHPLTSDLAGGSVACLRLSVQYVQGPVAEQQAAQSDRVTWQFLYTANA